MNKHSKVDSQTWQSHGHTVRFDCDATGYVWYFIDNMDSPCVIAPPWLIREASERMQK